MVVTWQNNRFLQGTRPPGFVSPEDWGHEAPTGLPNTPVGGVGQETQPAHVTTMFTPADAVGNGMFGGEEKSPGETAQPDGDFPSQATIDRRRRLAEALMGKQTEVNHPMQAVANAVSQIAGAWIGKKADDEQAQMEKRRRDMVAGGFEKSGGDFDKMMDEWMKSGDPELVDRALDYKLKKAAAASEGGSAPTTRTFYDGGMAVTKQWNSETKQWEDVGDPYPRWKDSGTEDGGFDPGAPGSSSTPGGTTTPGAGTDGQALPGPGPRGKWQPKITGFRRLKDGTKVAEIYNPNNGKSYYRAADGFREVPFDATPTTASSGGPVSPSGWMKLRRDWQEEKNSMDAIRAYFQTMKDIPSGYRRWANEFVSRLQTFMGQNNLTPEQLKQMIATGQIQGLLGMFRTTVVGPGVMTEYDAQRVIQALGGLPSSAFQNPEAMMQLLQDLYGRKLQNFQMLDEELGRNAPTYGYNYTPTVYPYNIGDPMPGDGGGGGRGGAPSAPSAPRTPRPSGSKVVLPPVEKRIIGKTEYQAPDGSTYVWGRDSSGKVGWMPK